MQGRQVDEVDVFIQNRTLDVVGFGGCSIKLMFINAR